MLDNASGPARAILFYLLTLGMALVIPLVGALGEASPLVTMVTPAVAVVVMMLGTGEGRSRAGWASLGAGRAGLKGWWLAILGPIVILVASYGVLIVIGLASLQAPAISGSTADITLDLAAGLGVGLIFAFTEEIGWRGYMLPRLAAIGVVPAMLIVGFLHGVWHLPLMLATPYYHAEGNPFVVVPLFLATLTLAGVFYGYLRLWTGSVWPVAIAHAVYNFVWAVGSDFVAAKDPTTMEYIGGESGILVIAGLVIVALVLIPRLRGQTFAAPDAPSVVRAA